MFIRSIGSLLALLAALSLTGGCKPAATPEKPKPGGPERPKPATPVAETVARLHWLGARRLATETNATYFMGLWSLPESQRLKEQTLDKFALFLAGVPIPTFNSVEPLTNFQSLVTNSTLASSLRPLLGDLLEEEGCLEIRRVPGQPVDLALALRLGDERAALWETNLAAALGLVAGAHPLPAEAGLRGWQWSPTNYLSLSRVADWTVIGLAPSPATPLARDFQVRVQLAHTPFRAAALDLWLEAEFETGPLAQALGVDWTPPAGWPKVLLALKGDGLNARTIGQLNFPQPLAMELEPWTLPTNYVQGALSSFLSVRGLKPWLESNPAWKRLEAGVAPNQFFSWGLVGVPAQTTFALPDASASNLVSRLTDLALLNNTNLFGASDIARFKRSQTADGLEWKGLGYLSPFLHSAGTNGDSMVLGGFFPLGALSSPIPAELFKLLSDTNLVAYDWDVTGTRIEQLVYIIQFLRFVTHHDQLPGDSAGLKWMRAAAPKLGNCASVLNRTGPASFAFIRKSTIGLSAIEMHWLADWLESPRFPRGLYSLVTPAPPEYNVPDTNAPAPSVPPVAPGR